LIQAAVGLSGGVGALLTKRSGLLLNARRFRCLLIDCPQRIFVERLDGTLARPFARRTSRLEGLVHHLGLALGGRPGQSFARRLLLPVSKDTLLRVVRRRAAQPSTEPRVVGIDDCAWKRGHRYGTIICDLERRRIIDILPDREAATVTAWLTEHPSITVIARDRGASYRQAATGGLPDAVQVADRRHLMENASAAFLNAVRRSMHTIRKAVGAGTVDPMSLTVAGRRQHAG
jgi:transposase